MCDSDSATAMGVAETVLHGYCRCCGNGATVVVIGNGRMDEEGRGSLPSSCVVVVVLVGPSVCFH